MSFFTAVVQLNETPTKTLDSNTGKEVVRAQAQIVGKEPVPITVQSLAGTATGEGMAAKNNQDLLLVNGEMVLGEENPVVLAMVLCDATPNQYLNEVVVVGNLGGEAKESESAKSCSRSVAMNRRRRVPGKEEAEELTDWYKIRGYGFSKDKLVEAPKGSLVGVSGCLESRQNKEGKPYYEVKCRTIKVYRRGGASGGSNPAVGTSAVGYSHDDFVGQQGEDISSFW